MCVTLTTLNVLAWPYLHLRRSCTTNFSCPRLAGIPTTAGGLNRSASTVMPQIWVTRPPDLTRRIAVDISSNQRRSYQLAGMHKQACVFKVVGWSAHSQVSGIPISHGPLVPNCEDNLCQCMSIFQSLFLLALHFTLHDNAKFQRIRTYMLSFLLRLTNKRHLPFYFLFNRDD